MDENDSGPVRARRLPRVLLGAVALVVALASASAVYATQVTGDGGEGAPARDLRPGDEVTFATVDRPVSAAELWSSTTGALRCVADAGFQTVGPYPKANGSGVAYSIGVADGYSAAEQRCFADTIPLNMRFSTEPVEAEREALRSIRAELVSCLQADGRLPADADDDAALFEVASGDPVSFRACVDGS